MGILDKIFLKVSKSQPRYSGFDLENYQPLPVIYELRAAILRKIRRGEEVLPDIDGREETKDDVIRAILSGAHPYLVSEEGTGKTRLARSLTKLLPQIPKIRGCPYNDNPKWPSYLLCPRCKESKNPVKEYGVEFVPGRKRFSRIQGNEYTNEAKLLGLKDIQAIAQGKSPSDPQVFTGTGVFRANRGILFVDELPAIRTKVQVLFHPILEEKKAILEEYNWEHPLDLLLIATGNPRGFAHVNEIPRPLLDRLELIYMDLPEEEVEKEIMLKEKFKIEEGYEVQEEEQEVSYPDLGGIERTVTAPWWIIDVINKAVRYSRICPYVEKKASIRATDKALDHTYASIEMEKGKVANLKHAYYGLRLALRGRVGLRADLIDFENPKKAFELSDQLVEDFLWNVFEDMGNENMILKDYDGEKLASELGSLFSEEISFTSRRFPPEILLRYEQLQRVINEMKKMASEKVNEDLLSKEEKILYFAPEKANALEEYNYSALETLVNIAIHKRIISESKVREIFVPKKFRGEGWK
jgi:MoxR-like ATPase